MRLFILDSKQAGIIASGENFEDKKNFLKKIGSNPRLAQRALQFSPKKSWEILLSAWDSATPATLARASREPNFGLHTDWLPDQASNIPLLFDRPFMDHVKAGFALIRAHASGASSE